MDNSVDLTNFKKNPELFKNMLKDTVEEIITGIGKEDYGEENNNVIQNFIVIIQNHYRKEVFPMFDNMWKQFEITKKVSVINRLEEIYPKNYDAWRPTPGEIPYLTLRGNYLTELRDRLIHKIDKCNKEENVLTNELITEAAKLKTYMKQLDHSKKLLSTMISDYEDINSKND